MLLSHLPFVLCLSNNLPLPPGFFFPALCIFQHVLQSPPAHPLRKQEQGQKTETIINKSASSRSPGPGPIQYSCFFSDATQRNATPTPQARGNREYLTLCNRRHAQVTVGAILVPSSRLVRLLVRLVLVDWVLGLRPIQRLLLVIFRCDSTSGSTVDARLLVIFSSLCASISLFV